MVFGFIGAGKVGCTLGKILKNHQQSVYGYYSKSPASAMEAAEFTETNMVNSLEELVKHCDAIFLTVPDDQLHDVYQELKEWLKPSICLIHCSGAKSSDVFENRQKYGIYGCSIHPLMAVSSKYESYKEFESCYLAMEGDEIYLEELQKIFQKIGNKVVLISKENKVRYHLAAVMASNLVVALLEKSFLQLTLCGFSYDEAREALQPLVLGNVMHVLEKSPVEALTGPVERGDYDTVKSHQEIFDIEDELLYNILSKELLRLAKAKNPSRDYSIMEQCFERKKDLR